MNVGVFIPSDARSSIERVEVDAEDADAMRTRIGGSYRSIRMTSPPALMFMTDGTLGHLELNHRATYVMWMHARTFIYSRVVCGDVLITGTQDDLGRVRDIPDALYEILVRKGKYRVEVLLDPTSPWVTNESVFESWDAAYEHAFLVHRSFRRIVHEMRVVRV